MSLKYISVNISNCCVVVIFIEWYIKVLFFVIIINKWVVGKKLNKLGSFVGFFYLI